MFIVLGLLISVATLVPGTGNETRLFIPDYLLCFIFVWLLREPEAAPPMAVAFVAIVADILQQRPIGLHAALIMVATEFARTQVWRRGETGFMGEWGIAALGILLIAIAERMVLTIALVPQAGFGATARLVASSAIAYPLVGLLLWAFPRVRVRDPADVHFGRRYGT